MRPLKMTSVRNNICGGKACIELHYRLTTTKGKLSPTVALVIIAKRWENPCHPSWGEQENQLCPEQPLHETVGS